MSKQPIPIYIGILILLLGCILSGCTQQTGITIDGDNNDWQNIPHKT